MRSKTDYEDKAMVGERPSPTRVPATPPPSSPVPTSPGAEPAPPPGTEVPPGEPAGRPTVIDVPGEGDPENREPTDEELEEEGEELDDELEDEGEAADVATHPTTEEAVRGP